MLLYSWQQQAGCMLHYLLKNLKGTLTREPFPRIFKIHSFRLGDSGHESSFIFGFYFSNIFDYLAPLCYRQRSVQNIQKIVKRNIKANILYLRFLKLRLPCGTSLAWKSEASEAQPYGLLIQNRGRKSCAGIILKPTFVSILHLLYCIQGKDFLQ